MKKTILISGIKGFLGSHLATALKSGYTLYGIGKDNENHNGIQVFSSKGLARISVVPDYVIMCHAAVSSGQTTLSKDLLFEVNVQVTQALAQKFKTSKLIYISSASVYDNNGGAISESSAINPKTDYAISKSAGENAVLDSGNAVVIRLSSLYGSGMKETTIIPNYVNQALNNKRIEVWGTGERKQNYIAVEDVCDCIKLAIENFEAVNGKILLCVGGKENSNTELAEIIAAETGAAIVYVNQDDSASVAYNNQATRELLGWVPKTDFNRGITNYIQWKKGPF